MNKFRFTINALAIAIFTLAFASLAQAQASRTWVSGVGDDANPCSRTAPCKTFAGAISKTAPGGEIDALDPGGFGAVTITKAITIDGGGGQVASVLVSGTNGIVVQAGNSDVVILRNLRINGISSGINGIRFTNGRALNVENCYIFGFTQNGIDISLTVANANLVFVSNCILKNNTGVGLRAATTAGQVKVAIVGTSFAENGTGLQAANNSRVDADRSGFYNNTGAGVNADGTGGVGVANITNSSLYNNGGAGISATNAGVGRINNCDLIQNGGNGALVGAGSEIDTWGNNRFVGNADGNVCNGGAGCTGQTPH